MLGTDIIAVQPTGFLIRQINGTLAGGGQLHVASCPPAASLDTASDIISELLQIHAQLTEYARCRGVLSTQHAEQQVIGFNRVASDRSCLFLSIEHGLPCLRCEPLPHDVCPPPPISPADTLTRCRSPDQTAVFQPGDCAADRGSRADQRRADSEPTTPRRRYPRPDREADAPCRSIHR